MIKNIFENNAILWKLLYSFAITFTVSVLGGLFFLSFGLNFWITSVFFFLLQLIVFYFYGEYVKRKNSFYKAQLELEAAIQLSKITANVTCPCDKKIKSEIQIDVNGDNTYQCGECYKKIGVLVETKTVLKTDPITHDPLTHPEVLNTFEEALKDPSHNDRV